MRRTVLGLAVLALAAPAGATTTKDGTIVPVTPSEPGGDFVFLKGGPGEGTVVREELATARAGRQRRRRSIAYFAQLTDFQLADEESPARVEVLDQTSATFSAAFRPHEALMPFLIDAAVRGVNRHKRLDFAILTGDNADNAQRNETEWVRTLLDGGRIDPNSGSAQAAASCPEVDPAEAPRYTGVQDYDDYEPAGDFYDPDQPFGLFAQWPSYPGLMDRAQRPFEATGLRIPSYVVPGNHDALVQGNQSASAGLDSQAQGCVKPMGSSDNGARPVMVPPDPEREFVTKSEYREIFANGEDGHGFAFVDEDELSASNGAASYYSHAPVRGLRMIGLDTIATGGVSGPSAEGNIDDPQLRWLERELAAAARAGELVIVYSHHGPTSLSADLPDELAGSCAVPTTGPGCDADPRNSEPIHLEDDVVDTLLAEPHVIAWVAGHSHVNDIAFRKAEGERSGFWVIRTSAEADWPHQDRLIELTDNRDGTLSLFGTLIDNVAPAAAPPAGEAAAFTTDQLASLARTFGYNDPQAGLSAAGEREDRNVELLISDPRPPTTRLRVIVRPRRVAAGRRTTLRVRVTQGGAAVRGARVRLRSAKARTNAKGRARLRITLRRPGVVRARKGAARGRATVTVAR